METISTTRLAAYRRALAHGHTVHCELWDGKRIRGVRVEDARIECDALEILTPRVNGESLWRKVMAGEWLVVAMADAVA